MKPGDLVRPKESYTQSTPNDPFLGGANVGNGAPTDWVGIIIEFDSGDPIVHWNSDFPNEREYIHQLEVIG